MNATEIKEEKATIHDRELEIQKVQALMSYFQTRINISYSIVFGFIIGFLIFLATLYYQGTIFTELTNVGINADLARIGNLIFFVAAGFLFYFVMKPKIERINMHSDNCLRIIDELFVKIDNGKPLLSLMELKALEYPEKSEKGKSLKVDQTKEQTERLGMDEVAREQIKGLYIVGILAALITIKVTAGTIANQTTDFWLFFLITFSVGYCFCMLFAYGGVPKRIELALKELAWVFLFFIFAGSIIFFIYVSWLVYLANNLYPIYIVVFAVCVAVLYYTKPFFRKLFRWDSN
jgi:hypothetical protein